VRRTALTILLALAAFSASPQQSHDDEKPFARLAERALHGWGRDAHLPPNISRELGLASQSAVVNVKQVAYHLNESEIIAFNVCTQNEKDIVIFRITESAWEYYLTSPEGVLRKAKHFEKPSAESQEFNPHKISSSKAQDGFKKEKQCWLDVAKTSRLAPSCVLSEK
jgi:hypothetical protein